MGDDAENFVLIAEQKVTQHQYRVTLDVIGLSFIWVFKGDNSGDRNECEKCEINGNAIFCQVLFELLLKI